MNKVVIERYLLKLVEGCGELFGLQNDKICRPVSPWRPIQPTGAAKSLCRHDDGQHRVGHN